MDSAQLMCCFLVFAQCYLSKITKTLLKKEICSNSLQRPIQKSRSVKIIPSLVCKHETLLECRVNVNTESVRGQNKVNNVLTILYLHNQLKCFIITWIECIIQ